MPLNLTRPTLIMTTSEILSSSPAISVEVPYRFLYCPKRYFASKHDGGSDCEFSTPAANMECARSDTAATASLPLVTPPEVHNNAFPSIGCSKVFSANGVLRLHAKRARSDQLPPPLIKSKKTTVECTFTCIHCCKVFSANNLLRQHVKKNHPDQELPPPLINYKRSVNRAKSNTTAFNCIHCCKVFSANNLLRQHVKKNHPDQELPPPLINYKRAVNHAKSSAVAFNCIHCCKVFPANNLLRRHVKKNHPDQELPPPLINYKRAVNHAKSNDTEFNCIHCCKVFSANSILRRHVKKNHPDQELPPPLINYKRAVNRVKSGATAAFNCIHCCKVFSANNLLRRHVKKNHPDQELPPPLINYKRATKHYEGGNGLVKDPASKAFVRRKFKGIHWITRTFGSFQEFEEWKEQEEDATDTRFVKSCGDRKTLKHLIRYFKCHRSGRCSPKTNGVRRSRVKGYLRIGITCPAVMVVKVSPTGSCAVFYCSEHKGHTFDLEHLKLRKRERKELAVQLAKGIPFRDVLKQFTNSAGPGTMYKKFISRKDLENISKEFGINRNVTLHQDGEISTTADVESMKETAGNLCFKPQNSRHYIRAPLQTIQPQVLSPEPQTNPTSQCTQADCSLQPQRTLVDVLDSVNGLFTSIQQSCISENMAIAAENELKRVLSLLNVCGNSLSPTKDRPLEMANKESILQHADGMLIRSKGTSHQYSSLSNKKAIGSNEVAGSKAISVPVVSSVTKDPVHTDINLALSTCATPTVLIKHTTGHINGSNITKTPLVVNEEMAPPLKIIIFPKMKMNK